MGGLIISSILLGSGLLFLIREYKFSRYGFHTTGTVIDTGGKWDYERRSADYMFYPIVQFYAEDGKLMQERLAVGTNVSFHKKNQSIKVVYYDGKVYPRGLGWKLFYWSFFLSGLGAMVYLYCW